MRHHPSPTAGLAPVWLTVDLKVDETFFVNTANTESRNDERESRRPLADAINYGKWWRRAALVSTVPLNLRSAGGTGDTMRTLDICRRLVGDHEDMVVKGLSWALRELVVWDPDAVRGFLSQHKDSLAARVVERSRASSIRGSRAPAQLGPLLRTLSYVKIATNDGVIEGENTRPTASVRECS